MSQYPKRVFGEEGLYEQTDGLEAVLSDCFKTVKDLTTMNNGFWHQKDGNLVQTFPPYSMVNHGLGLIPAELLLRITGFGGPHLTPCLVQPNNQLM